MFFVPLKLSFVESFKEQSILFEITSRQARQSALETMRQNDRQAALEPMDG